MKTFNIESIKPNLPFRIAHKNVTLPSVRMFLDKKYRYSIDYDVYLEDYGINLQREFVWTLEQKQELVLSILKDINIPQFAVVVYSDDDPLGDRLYKIIDGKQRLSAILGFCKNEFPIPSDGELFYFNELPVNIQDFLMRWSGDAQVAYSYPNDKISDAGLIQWFRLLNFTGTEQDKKHVELLKSKYESPSIPGSASTIPTRPRNAHPLRRMHGSK